MTEERESDWHLDKRIPIALIITILLQTGGAIWWASSTSTRLQAVERTLQSDGATARLARLEVQMDAVLNSLERMERRMGGTGSTIYIGPPQVPRNASVMMEALAVPAYGSPLN